MSDRFTRLRLLAAVGAVLLSGCSWTGSFFQSDKVAYESAQQARSPLEVPPDLSQLPRDDRFLVPEPPQTITASASRRRATRHRRRTDRRHVRRGSRWRRGEDRAAGQPALARGRTFHRSASGLCWSISGRPSG
jgi:hypothetical protein